MSERDHQEAMGSENVKSEARSGDLGAELRRFGEQLAKAATSAWESEASRNIRTQMGEALRAMARELDEAAERIRTSEETHKLRRQAERVVETVRESEIAEEVQEGLVTGLRELNALLEKAIRKLEKESKKDEDTVS